MTVTARGFTGHSFIQVSSCTESMTGICLAAMLHVWVLMKKYGIRQAAAWLPTREQGSAYWRRLMCDSGSILLLGTCMLPVSTLHSYLLSPFLLLNSPVTASDWAIHRHWLALTGSHSVRATCVCHGAILLAACIRTRARCFRVHHACDIIMYKHCCAINPDDGGSHPHMCQGACAQTE
jgi:hypothetical protein